MNKVIKHKLYVDRLRLRARVPNVTIIIIIANQNVPTDLRQRIDSIVVIRFLVMLFFI
jgi:hypothetical protein